MNRFSGWWAPEFSCEHQSVPHDPLSGMSQSLLSARRVLQSRDRTLIPIYLAQGLTHLLSQGWSFERLVFLLSQHHFPLPLVSASNLNFGKPKYYVHSWCINLGSCDMSAHIGPSLPNGCFEGFGHGGWPCEMAV